MRPDPVVIALRERVEELEETIRQLRTQPKDIPVWNGLHLRPDECILLDALTTRPGLCSFDYLIGRLKSLGDWRDPSEASLRVAIFRLRKKLARLDPAIVIRNVWGEGYWIDVDGRVLLAERRVKATEGIPV